MSDNEIVAIGTAPASPPIPDLATPTPFTAPAVSALGGRSTAVPPAIDVQFLRQACDTPSVLPNASRSPGASPILKEFLAESGYPYTVQREVYNDGGAHQAGNAIDVVSDDLAAICRFLAKVPKLFDAVVYADPTYANESLYILNGAVTSSSSFTERTGTQIHMATTFTRFAAALKLTSVVSALGTAALGQFTNRNVYAVQVPDIGGLKSDPMVGFW